MSLYLDDQRRRWLKPNAAAWLRPDAARWLLPNQKIWQGGARSEQKYSPDQPRVPRGYREGGRWTDDETHWTPVSAGDGISIALPTINVSPESDELADFANELWARLGQTLNDLRDELARVRLAGDIPTGDSPPEIPKERPRNSWDRTAALKAVAREVRKGVALNVLIFKAPWILTHLAVIESYNDPPKFLEELKSAVSIYRPGTDIHHIVRQSAIQFPRDLINSPKNLVRIPRMKHHDINRWYQKENPEYGGQTPLEYLEGRSWDVHYAVGLHALRHFKVLKP